MVPGPIKEINACLLSARYRRTYFLLSCRHTNRVFAFREKSENPNDGQGPSRRRIRLYHPRSHGLRRFSGRREGYEDSWVRIVSRDITFSVRPPPTLSYTLSFFSPNSVHILLLSPVAQKEKGEEGRLQSRFSASRRLLASCYFYIPVNRVWNPICLFATASKLPQQRQPCVIPFHPSYLFGTITCRFVYSLTAHIHAQTRIHTTQQANPFFSFHLFTLLQNAWSLYARELLCFSIIWRIFACSFVIFRTKIVLRQVARNTDSFHDFVWIIKPSSWQLFLSVLESKIKIENNMLFFNICIYSQIITVSHFFQW